MEYNFWCDLFTNAVGGIFAAIGFAVIVFLWNMNKRKKLNELASIMGEIIEHRNKGESNKYSNVDEWVNTAKELEIKAIDKANEFSSTAGILLNWLDRVEAHKINDQKGLYISILTTISQRIRELLERNTISRV